MSDDLERRLRDSLDANAARAPHGDRLAELIIAEAVHGATPLRRRTARAWVLPLLAAAAVAAVVLAAVGVSQWRTSSAPPAHSGVAPVPTPTVFKTVTVSPTTHSSPTQQQSSPSTHPSTTGTTSTDPSTPTQLKNFKLLDMTFVFENTGWALGTANCVATSGTCPALLHTTDGVTWKSMPSGVGDVPGDNVGCAKGCVEHIRFANANDGYVWGPSKFLTTTDGGQVWTPQSGGASELETLHNVVVRVHGYAAGKACSPCTVQTAPVGSTNWTTSTLPAGLTNIGQLTFAGNTLAMYGTYKQNSRNLLTSTDNGRTWVDRGRPCESINTTFRQIRQIAGSTDGTLVLECEPTEGGAPTESVKLLVSSDGGQDFTPRSVPRAYAPPDGLIAFDASTFAISYDEGVFVSSDGGRNWIARAHSDAQPDPLPSPYNFDIDGFLGNESTTTARFVGADRRTVWTTRNEGAQWYATTFTG